MENNFTRTRSTSNIAVSILTVVIGCVCTLVPESDSINIFGVLAIFTGFILFFTLKSEYVHNESGKKYKKSSLSYSREAKNTLVKAIAKPEDYKNEFSQGESIMLLIFHNKENAYMQLLEYIPHQYVPCSEIYKHDISKVKNFIK